MSKKYFSNKYCKIVTLNSVLQVLSKDQNTNDKLIIHTANGIYIGTFRDINDFNSLDLQKGDDILTIYRKTYLKNIDNYENSTIEDKAEQLSENAVSVFLEDVKLITSGNTINLPFVEIFTDQIIGLSLGTDSQ